MFAALVFLVIYSLASVLLIFIKRFDYFSLFAPLLFVTYPSANLAYFTRFFEGPINYFMVYQEVVFAFFSLMNLLFAS